MGLLNREALLKKDALRIERVDLSGDEFVCVKEMTGTERDAFEESLVVEIKNRDGSVRDYKRSLENFRARLACATMCDEKGNLLLKITDADVLGKHMSARKLEKIVEKAQEVNRITQQDRDVMVKNLEGGQAADSTSDSQGS